MNNKTVYLKRLKFTKNLSITVHIIVFILRIQMKKTKMNLVPSLEVTYKRYLKYLIGESNKMMSNILSLN